MPKKSQINEYSDPLNLGSEPTNEKTSLALLNDVMIRQGTYDLTMAHDGTTSSIGVL